MSINDAWNFVHIGSAADEDGDESKDENEDDGTLIAVDDVLEERVEAEVAGMDS